MITMLVLTKYQDIFDRLVQSWHTYAADDIEHRVLVVRDGDVKVPAEWVAVDGPKPFHYCKSINLGFKLSEPDDVFLVLDDMQFTQPNTIRRLNLIMEEQRDLAALSVVVPGGSCSLGYQWIGARPEPLFTCQFMDYPAVYFRRSALVPMDEQFIGYGWEDIDHCLTMVQAGWTLGVASNIHMNHGIDGPGMSATFKRVKVPEDQNLVANGERFTKKWRGKLGFLGEIRPDSPLHVFLKGVQG